MITLQIKLFGAFRNFGNGEFIEMSVPKKSNISEIKSLFLKQLQALHPELNKDFKSEGLIEDSVFATEEMILDSKTILENIAEQNQIKMAILPPVCGG